MCFCGWGVCVGLCVWVCVCVCEGVGIYAYMVGVC